MGEIRMASPPFANDENVVMVVKSSVFLMETSKKKT